MASYISVKRKLDCNIFYGERIAVANFAGVEQKLIVIHSCRICNCNEMDGETAQQ